jgi:predicted AlkP superfamily phosphohydrolase/phosphomutase
MEGVIVNLVGRQPQGAVTRDQYERVRDDIIRAFLDFRDPQNGNAIVEWAKRREDVYAGRETAGAPDVLVCFAPDYRGAAGDGDAVTRELESKLRKHCGVHAAEGILVMSGPDVIAGVDLGSANLVDIAPTILALCGEPPTSEMHGDVLIHGLRNGLVRDATLRTPAREDPTPTPSAALSAEEEATLERSLKALGYLE